MKVYAYIKSLVGYGLKQGLITADDAIYARNQLLERLFLDSYEEPEDGELIPLSEGEAVGDSLERILCGLCDYAADTGDKKACAAGAKRAADYFYKLSRDSDYIRRYRVKKDLRWKTETPYGALDITINLSKPEKDPRDIAAARKMKASGYPKCLLCIDNVGYGGRADHPARDNHRIIPLKLCGEDWGLQYSPYVYYNEHCIVFNQKHTPMQISDRTFYRLFEFVKRFPHYMLGSNADLPIVGGSILTHDHFQGGNYEFPMAKAPLLQEFETPGHISGVRAGIVRWPLSVLRLSGRDTAQICALAGEVLSAWRGYTDEAACVYAETEGEPHNTITPIARCRDGVFELDLVLRNNLTTKEHPMGLYHPHAKLHHIKKENIGLIEVMGLAVLPARLKTEMEQMEGIILQECEKAAEKECEKAAEKAGGREESCRAEKHCAGKDCADDGHTGDDARFLRILKAVSARMRSDEALLGHADWAEEWLSDFLSENGSREGEALSEALSACVREEIGKVFCAVLEDAGVYRCTKEGEAAFARFLKTVGFHIK